MLLLQDVQLTDESTCPYGSENPCRYAVFFATDISAVEMDEILSRGWRKFGSSFFRPVGECKDCQPVRTRVQEFTPTKSQRRVLRRNSDIRVEFSPLVFRDEIFDIYAEHSLVRFNKVDTIETFIEHFYSPPCPALQSEFYLDGKLCAVGFLDRAGKGLSSVYFVYRDIMKPRSIGIFSMLSEIEYAKSMGLDWYYPGYYIEHNSHMRYKNRFHPVEYLDWHTGIWNEGA